MDSSSFEVCPPLIQVTTSGSDDIALGEIERFGFFATRIVAFLSFEVAFFLYFGFSTSTLLLRIFNHKICWN